MLGPTTPGWARDVGLAGTVAGNVGQNCARWQPRAQPMGRYRPIGAEDGCQEQSRRRAEVLRCHSTKAGGSAQGRSYALLRQEGTRLAAYDETLKSSRPDGGGE